MSSSENQDDGIQPDLLTIIAQILAVQGHKQTLLNLSLTSKDNFRLLAPILYRHLVLTDKSAPKLFRYFLTFHSDVRFLFFASIDEDVDIASPGCHPIIRLRRYLTFVFKITVDTSYTEPKVFNVMAAWAKGLRELCQDLVFPNAKRLVLTAKSPADKNLRLIGVDDRHHELATFLPLACDPQYICYTPPPPLPKPRRMMGGIFEGGPATYMVMFDDGILPVWSYWAGEPHEVVNIHQASSVMYPNRDLTKCKVSFAPPECCVGDVKCEEPEHPTRCQASDLEAKMSKLLGFCMRPRPGSDVVSFDKWVKNQMVIVERDGQGASFREHLDTAIESAVAIVLRPPFTPSKPIKLGTTPQDAIKRMRDAITISKENIQCEACGGKSSQ
ncbi:hypothetical protein IAU59_001749 [Kwoniella sp. CBS 9459]